MTTTDPNATEELLSIRLPTAVLARVDRIRKFLSCDDRPVSREGAIRQSVERGVEALEAAEAKGSLLAMIKVFMAGGRHRDVLNLLWGKPLTVEDIAPQVQWGEQAIQKVQVVLDELDVEGFIDRSGDSSYSLTPRGTWQIYLAQQKSGVDAPGSATKSR